MKMKFALGTLAASALLASGAFAATPSLQIDQMTVDAAGLNLARPADVARLYARIRFAADQVCGPRNITGFYYTRASYTSCVSAAVQQGVAAFNSDTLTSYYQEHAAQPVRVAEQ
ncbi:MAG TPA: UrcA family protein [Steroidobacteraceae bacterium]|nr:UrcA family protein [Steroidobacteraceae bacterium]